MKRNKVEQRIFDAADRLTPEPPDFAEIDESVNWQEVALQSRGNKQKRRWIRPAIVGALACLAAGVLTVGVYLLLRGPEYYGGGGDRPVIFGDFAADSWICSDPAVDLSSSSLNISPDRTGSASGTALLFDEYSEFIGSASFFGDPLASFEYGPLSLDRGEFLGNAVYSGIDFPIAISFSPSNSQSKTVTVTFGDGSSSYYGEIVFRYIR